MASSNINKRLSALSNKIKSQSDKSSSLEERVNLLERELRDSLVLISSMIEVNKELLARQKSDSSTPTDDRPVSDKDSTNTILKKIYTFFVKGSERDKRNYELQRDREQEQIMESRRRKSSRKATATKIDPKKPSSNPILDLLGFVGSGIAGIFKFVTGGLFGIISKGITSIVKLIKTIIEKIPGGSLLTGAIGLGGDIVATIVNVLKASVGTIWDLIKPIVLGTIATVISGLGTIISGVIDNLFSVIGITKKVIKAGIYRLNPGTLIASLGLSAYEAYSAIDDMNQTVFYGEDITDQQSKVDTMKEFIDNPILANEKVSLEERDKYLGLTKEQQDNYKTEKTKLWIEESAKLSNKLRERYDYLAKILEPMGYEKVKRTEQTPYSLWDKLKSFAYGQGPLSGVNLRTIDTIGFRKKGDPSSPFIDFAKIGEGPGMSSKVDNPMLDQILMSANIVTGGMYDKINTQLTDIKNQGLQSLTSDQRESFNRVTSSTPTNAPVTTPSTSSATPVPVTPVAPSEKAEPDSPSVTSNVTTPPVAPRVPSSIPSLMDSDYMESGEATVINNSSQSSVSNEESDYSGTPNVRNPNPIVYRTAMFNDQALARL